MLCTDAGDPLATGAICGTLLEAQHDAIKWAANEQALDKWKFEFNLNNHQTLVNEIRKQQQQQTMSEFKPTPFDKILNKEEHTDGDIIKCVRGRITGLFKPTGGEKDGQPYTYQNGEMVDEAGTKIKVSFSNNDQPLTAKGKWVTITGQKSENHGFQGIKVVDNNYFSKKLNKQIDERLIRITGTAIVAYDGGEPANDVPQGRSQEPARNGGGTAGPSQTRPSGVHPLLILKDITALHGKCVDLVNEIYGEKAFPEYAATIFIEACRQGLQHDAAKQLAAPIPKIYPPAPKDPTLWKQCVVPKGANEGKTLEQLNDEDLMEFFNYYDNHDAPKVRNGAFAECVYQAARDRKLIPPPSEEPSPEDPEPDPDAPEDDIPF